MKNKILAAVSAAVLSLSLFGGCKPKINEKPSDDYEVNLNVDKNTEATLSVMVPSGDGGLEAKYVEALAEGFKELFPKVTVKLDYRDISDNSYAASVNAAILDIGSKKVNVASCRRAGVRRPRYRIREPPPIRIINV